MNMDKKMYSTIEVAKILRLSRIEVFRKIKKGKIKAEKVGRNYVIAHDDLMEALGQIVGLVKKERIEDAVKKAIKEYGQTFKKLGKE
ncbi:helix-turn-helix domain-containing protein [Patescibacteria group bacterium]|nr:helix-turn-helix domain-containing protein [Patescibacteria group bacterium]